MALNTILIALMITMVSSECTHPIFCNTDILNAVSNSTFFPDSKTFTDQVLLVPIDKALSKLLCKISSVQNHAIR